MYEFAKFLLKRYYKLRFKITVIGKRQSAGNGSGHALFKSYR